MKNKLKKIYWTVAAFILAMLPHTALAAPDPVAGINNLKNLFLNILSAAGVIIVVWGIVQVAMGFYSQDGTQKTQGVLFLVGGFLMAGVGVILGLLGF